MDLWSIFNDFATDFQGIVIGFAKDLQWTRTGNAIDLQGIRNGFTLYLLWWVYNEFVMAAQMEVSQRSSTPTAASERMAALLARVRARETSEREGAQ